MKEKIVGQWFLVVTLLVLLSVVLALNLPAVAALGSRPTPVSPLPTGAAARVTPILDEQEAANQLEAQIIGVYEDASPSVVNITNRSIVYDYFMGASPQEGTGSGFVYDDKGHIVTNYHVIEDADELLVTLADGQVFSAEVVGSDPTNDLAAIRLTAEADLPTPLVLGDSDKLRVGQFVVAIGNPYGLQRTLTTGVASALGRVIESPEANEFIGEAIQTDAAINPGNSGGPMLDLRGRVIGINSQIISPSGGSAGIGFAVSAKTVQRVVPELIARGHYPHPWLGVQTLSLSPSIAAMLREGGIEVGADSGVLVLQATAGGPADRAGIRGGSNVVRMGRYRLLLGGDIIIAVNAEPIDDFQDLTVYLETKTTVGDRVNLTILRDAQELAVSVTLAEQPQR